LESQDVSETVIASELSGVLNWALDGLERLLGRGGFADRPAGVQSLLTQTPSGSSSVHAWVDDRRVRVVAGSAIWKDTIYQGYCQWCDVQSVDALAVATFWIRARQALPGLSIRKKITDGQELRYANLQIGALALVSSG
jgi:putative DNA primase/helicase